MPPSRTPECFCPGGPMAEGQRLGPPIPSSFICWLLFPAWSQPPAAGRSHIPGAQETRGSALTGLLPLCSVCVIRVMCLFNSDSYMFPCFSLSLTQCPQSPQVLTSGKKGLLLAWSIAHIYDPTCSKCPTWGTSDSTNSGPEPLLSLTRPLLLALCPAVFPSALSHLCPGPTTQPALQQGPRCARVWSPPGPDYPHSPWSAARCCISRLSQTLLHRMV